MLTKAALNRILKTVETIGELLSAWQDAMGYNDSEAARHLGLGVEHYWRIKRNKRTDLRPDTFKKLADGTGIAYERLVVAAAIARSRNIEPSNRLGPPVTA